ncbi:response regulator [Acidovorax radicis]|uniref:response regulator n=1 Tax=Acidovorax radicis TaxID=758826 RepID=UPI001CF91E2F|nr:response regulator [Acidovorax radicis]UCU98125.1 response regulator [Acidovorax radicis]
MPKILLLDDEPHVLSAIKRSLRAGLGTEVRIEETVAPEVALARLREAVFDVVISDYRMPLMTGVEFLSLVRTIQPLAVRMVLSASSDSEALMRAVNDAEVFRYVLKPWDEKDLIGHVRAALERADQLRRDVALAEVGRYEFGEISATELERRRLEALEPGLTHVAWGPNGEVLGPES